ncbi:MAG: ESPR-type extended signal peptide-containing protein, partial [Sutterellaceae bacterium]|nr:ESPR-type extended signal peptide-containing protein [Sutterellaceae bacterium]
MNQTFRVVFNRARGALMVANEVTSSVQKKGTKTMVAVAAAAMMVGSAMAEDAEIVVPKKEAVAVTPSMTVTTPTVAENSAKANTGLFVVYDELAAVVTGNSDFGASAAVGEGAQASYTMKEEGQNQFGLNGGSYSGFTAANGNETAAAGGSIFGVYGASINAKVEGVTFEDNTASRGGVGYVRSDKTFEVTGSTHTNNTSTGSAGVYDLHGLNGSLTATITGSKFEGNKATANAGAIRAEKTALTIKDSEFKNNVATGTEGKNGRGGAIEAINGSKLTVENTTFDGNSAIQGGAVLADNSTLVFTDTTFTNNTAQAWGGAVRFWQDNQTEGSDVTFAVTEGKDIAYVGNKAGQDEALAEKYADMGGLLYMGTAGKVDFAMEKDATLTIGEASATDK